MRREYQIIKPNYWKRNYEIHTYEGLKLGEVFWKSAFSYKANLIGRTRKWAVKTNGWTSRIILMDNRGVEIGIVKRGTWSNKTIFSYKDKEYRFRRYHWASNIYLWEDVEGRKLMSFKGRYYGQRKVGTMRIYTDMDNEMMELMMHFGWYLLTHLQVQQASSAAA